MTTLPTSLRQARARMAASVAAAGGQMPPLPNQATQAVEVPPPAAAAPPATTAAPAPAAPPATTAAPAPAAPPVTTVAPAPAAPPVTTVAPAPAAPPVTTAPAQNDTLIQQLLAQNSQLIQQMQDMAARQHTPPAPEPEEPDFSVTAQAGSLTAEEKQTFAGAENFVRVLARQEAMAIINQILPELNATRKRAAKVEKDLDTRVTGVAKQTFEQALASAVPNIAALTQNPAFNQFIDRPAPFQPGVTLRSILSSAYNRQDLSTIREIVSKFNETQTPAPGNGHPAPDPNAFVQPVVAGGAPAVPTDTPPQEVMTASQRAADYHAYRTGAMPLAQWKVKQSAYDKAVIDGHFDATK